MSAEIVDEIVRLAERLTPEERDEAVTRIQQQDKLPRKFSGRVTREMLLAEHERLKSAGAFDKVQSLRGKFANSNVGPTAEELDKFLNEIQTAWKEELDEYDDN